MEEKPDTDFSLLRYIDVLLDTYPEGVSQRELAARAGVTEPAVSKMKKKLYDVSVKDRFAFHEIVLSTEPPVFWRVATVLLSNKMFSRLLLSRYGKAVIQTFDFHSKISDAYKPYAQFFTRDETNLMVATVIVQLTVLDRIDKIGRKIGRVEEQIPALTLQFGKLLSEALAQFRLKIGNEKQLATWLGIRDKWYFLIESYLFQKVTSLEILKHVEDPETYTRVYRDTTSFYLALAFDPITEFIKSCAKKENVRFNPKYETIGSVWVLPGRPAAKGSRRE